MEKHLYICQNCGVTYKPKRRKVQKYCSNSCRSRAYFLRNPKLGLAKPEIQKTENNKIESMSFAGVGNAAVGTLAINALTSILTKEENKPATKKDLKEIKELLLSRFHRINSIPPNQFGDLPYLDLRTNLIVYLKKENYGK